MGAGLAVACATLGHPLVVTLSAGNSPQRARMLEALGAEVVLVPQVDGVPGQVTGADVAAAAEAARHAARARGGFYVDQFHAPEGVAIHRDTTGPEIWAQCGGRIDAWVASVGTGATFLGVAAALRARIPHVLCAAVEPEGCRRWRASPSPSRAMSCRGRATAACRRIGIRAHGSGPRGVRRRGRALAPVAGDAGGLHVGYSAAANVCAAASLLASGRLPADAVAVTVLCDTGLKY